MNMLLIVAYILSMLFFGYELYDYIKTQKEIDKLVNDAIQRQHHMNYVSNTCSGINIDDLLKDLES